MDKQKYKNALNALNDRQREAVKTIEGPVMVIAGPGTGKTQILSMRIAYILAETDTSANSILALTFTESGAVSIRKRLLELVGKPAYDVSVHTFHGFANSVIQTYPDHFPKIIGGRQCEPIEQIEIIQNIIESNPFETIKPFGSQFYYVRPIISTIQDLKREGYDPDSFESLLKKQIRDFEAIEDLYHEKGKYKGQMKGMYIAIEKKIKKNHELLKVYRSYEEEKQVRGLYDYDDMILEVLHALENDNDFLLMLQERYLYILADEHQDANRSQNRLLELLSSFHENPNIFVVGDDKQAIYRFQGASLKNFLYFKDHYPRAHIIDLEDNYRSTQHILDISTNLITNNSVLSKRPLTSHTSKPTTNARIIKANNPTSEATSVVREVITLLDNGETPEEIAILFRNNRHAGPIRDALVRAGIDYSLYGAAAETPHVITEQFLDILKIVSDPTEEPLLAKVLFYSFFKLDAKDIFFVFQSIKTSRSSLLEYVTNNPDDPVSTVITLILNLHKASENLSLRSLFDKIIKDTNIIESILGDSDSARALKEIQSLFALAKTIEVAGNRIPLNEYLNKIERAREYNLPIFSSHTNKSAGVQLMTVHRSKGLEFNSVFVTGLTDSNWGGRKNPEYFYLPELKSLKINEAERAKEDERRLFYVALTRAKQNLTLSYWAQNEEGREEVESQFLAELGDGLGVDEACEEPGILEMDAISSQSSLLDKDTISNELFRRGLNATAINKYLRCSWDYFFTSLIRLPQSYSTSALFGTAMHSALQQYFDARNNGEADPDSRALGVLKTKLFESELDETEAQRFYDRGSNALEGYFQEYRLLPIQDNELEKNIKVEIETKQGRIKLTGNIDKIERSTENKLTVTDYKTGKPKSRNELEGNTKNADGNYKRQLTFYSILLTESGEQMEAGVIDFLEPNERGKYKRESFIISEEEREALKETIEIMTEDIVSLSFPDKGCKEKTCEWCRLANFIDADPGN